MPKKVKSFKESSKGEKKKRKMKPLVWPVVTAIPDVDPLASTVVKESRVEKKQEAVTAVKPAVSSSVVLTEEQSEILEKVIKNIDICPVQTLGGLAGSGKTTLVSHLSSTLRNFAFCAFTGKAAEVLTSKGVPATTIHSLIYNMMKDKNGLPIFLLKASLPYCGIVVDEASMVSRDIHDDLVSFGLPLLFVGDHGQLEPVGDTFSIMKSPQYRLETVHRNAGEIAMFAHHLRNGSESTLFNAVDSKVNIIHRDNGYGHLLSGMDQIICAFNRTRIAVNKHMRKEMGFPEYPVKGDRVISLRNSKKFRIYNGTQATIQEVKSGKLVISTDNRTFTIPYNPDTFDQERPDHYDVKEHPFDYAYAITCHKAQGSEWEKVLVLEEKCDKWDHRRWAYTAASRAKKELNWIVR